MTVKLKVFVFNQMLNGRFSTKKLLIHPKILLIVEFILCILRNLVFRKTDYVYFKIIQGFFICSKLLCHCPNNPTPGRGYQVSGCRAAYPAGSPYLLQSALKLVHQKYSFFYLWKLWTVFWNMKLFDPFCLSKP